MKLKKHIFLSCLALISGLLVSAQNGPDPNLGVFYFKKGNYPEAIKIFNQVLKITPDDKKSNFYIGQAYLKSEIDPQKALFYIKRVYDSVKMKGDYSYFLGLAEMHHLNYEQAKIYLTEYSSKFLRFKYKKDARLQIKKCAAAIDLKRNPIEVDITNLGDKINTEFPEFYPFFYEKDSTLFFSTRRPRKGTATEFDGLYQSDVYSCKLNGDKIENLTEREKINTKLDDQMAGLDAERNLYIYIDHIDEYGNIHKYSQREPNQYRRVKDFNLLSEPKDIETTVYFTADGKKMFYTSNNKKIGKGGYDIFYREKTDGASWSAPISLNINTQFDEGFPFLSSDEKTLYFCSNGLPGMGGFDLYKSTWNENTNTWNNPENLGFPINTPSDEKFIWFMSDMKTAFISGYRKDGIGYADIYKVIFKQ